MKQNDRNNADGYYYTLAHFVTCVNVKGAIQLCRKAIRQLGFFLNCLMDLLIAKAEFQLPAPVAVMTQQIQIQCMQ